MKRFTIILVLVICSNIYSQLGWQKILNADTCRIEVFKHFKVTFDSKKLIYIRFGMSPAPIHSNQALYHSWTKLDKSTGSWIINPHNSFLYSNPFFCPWPNVMAWRYYKVDNFAFSSSDPNLMLQTRDVPPCGTGIQEPIQDTRITYNNGSTVTSYPQFYNGAFGNQCGGFDIDPVNDQVMYFCYGVGGSGKFVYKSTNRGNNWSVVDTVPLVPNYGTLKINPLRRNDVFIRTNTTMYRSINSGVNFVSVGGASFAELIFNLADSSIYGYHQTSVYKSTNHGSNWSVISTISSANIRAMEINPNNYNIMYAGNDSGLYRSTNAGISWSLCNNSFIPSRRVIGISKDNGTGDTLYVATSDAVYKVWGCFIAVGVNIISAEVPKVYSLSQNYPNPFNPVTSIKFEIPQKGFVKLVVYDALGKEIETLVNNELAPGVYNANWNAGSYPSGIYFYRLSADDFTDTKKMVLIK